MPWKGLLAAMPAKSRGGQLQPLGAALTLLGGQRKKDWNAKCASWPMTALVCDHDRLERRPVRPCQPLECRQAWLLDRAQHRVCHFLRSLCMGNLAQGHHHRVSGRSPERTATGAKQPSGRNTRLGRQAHIGHPVLDGVGYLVCDLDTFWMALGWVQNALWMAFG